MNGRRMLAAWAVAVGLLAAAAGRVDAQAGWPDAPLGQDAAALTLGGGDADFTGNKIWLEKSTWPGADGWKGPMGFERPGDPQGFWPYATAAQLPDGGSGFARWRAILPAYPADFYVPSDSRYIAIEYKDNLLSPRLDVRRPKGDGPSVKIGSVKLGELEARRDHQWKRVVFAVPSGVQREKGRSFRVRLGGGTYGQNEFYGSALVHRIIAAKGPIPARTPAAGFWPATTPVMADGRLLDRSGRPYVPVIVNTPYSNMDLNQIDLLNLIGANTNVALGSAEGAGRRGWAPSDYVTATERHMGVPTNMAESIARGYFAVPWVYTDTWKYYIERMGVSIAYGGEPYQSMYDGTWRGVVRVWERALADHVAANPNVPYVYLKDEWDHESVDWGSTEEQVVELRAVANRVAPGVPTVVTAMGWKQLMHLASYDLADVVATDRYPEEARIAEVAEWAEELRRVSNGRAFFNVLALTRAYNNVRNDPSQWVSVDYLRSGLYMTLTHGARGFWMFADPGGMRDDYARAYYMSIRPLTDELTALADVVHASATELGRTVATTRLGGDFFPLTYRATGDGTSETDGVSTVYRRSDARGVLITVNEWNESRAARLRVSTVRAGDQIPVLFEGRVVIADQDGSFVDAYAPFERHVYQLP